LKISTFYFNSIILFRFLQDVEGLISSSNQPSSSSTNQQQQQQQPPDPFTNHLLAKVLVI